VMRGKQSAMGLRNVIDLRSEMGLRNSVELKFGAEVRRDFEFSRCFLILETFLNCLKEILNKTMGNS
jgi:hypothetical protein